jgi:KamA family protein
LPDGQLAQLASELGEIPHLRRLRIHTRLPVVLPERVDQAFLAWFTGGRLQPVLVIHVNHANELSPAVRAACQSMRSAGITLLSQSVLLRGVNDQVCDQVALSESLMAAGVIPYYLHVLDHVQGAAHFYVSDDDARALMRTLASQLPGYLVPRLVREEPGASGKTPIAW